jgi:hypothetical protein
MGLELPLGPFYLDTEVCAKKAASDNGSFDGNAAAVFSDRNIPVPAVRLSFGRKFDS